MTGLAWEADKQPLTHAVPASLCHVLGTLPRVCCDGSLGVELPSQFRTSDYLLYDPEKLWKDLEGKKKGDHADIQGKNTEFHLQVGEM